MEQREEKLERQEILKYVINNSFFEYVSEKLPEPGTTVNYESYSSPYIYKFSKNKSILLDEMMYFIDHISTTDKHGSPSTNERYGDLIHWAWTIHLHFIPKENVLQDVFLDPGLMKRMEDNLSLFGEEIICEFRKFWNMFRKTRIFDEPSGRRMLSIYVVKTDEYGYLFLILYTDSNKESPSQYRKSFPVDKQKCRDILSFMIDNYLNLITDDATHNHHLVPRYHL